MGTTVRVRFWRSPAAEVPAGEPDRVAWLYERWQVLDDWVGRQREHRWLPAAMSGVRRDLRLAVVGRGVALEEAGEEGGG